jgi:hypothetical protein
MKVIISEKQYGQLKEALGVPDNILEASEKFYEIFLRHLQSIKNKSDEYNFSGDFSESIVLGGKKLINIDDYELEVKVVEVDTFSEKPKIVSMGMSQSFAFDTKIMMSRVSESKTADFNMTFIVSPDWKPEELAEEFIRDKEEYISSLSHEIKHKYDKQVKKIGLLGDDSDYTAVQKLRGSGVDTLDTTFLFYMYFMHGVESLVRPTEIASRIKTRNTTKSQFKDFLTDTQVYKHLVEIRNFSFEKFVNILKDDMTEIERNIDYSDMSDKEKIIEFLEIIFYSLGNLRLKDFKSFMEGPMGGVLSFIEYLKGGSDDNIEKKKEQVFNKYKNTVVKYQKNPVEYFKYEIERMSREANDVLKKLGKLYALAKDDE